MTWTRLPQGYKNSSTLFDEALHQDLQEFRREHPKVSLLQYVDDLLLSAETQEDCKEATVALLRTLDQLGYRVSAKKAQVCSKKVTYLGYILKDGMRWLSDERKRTVLDIPTPTNRQEVRGFLGSAGFCWLWIPGFAEMAKPLYEATKERNKDFAWEPAQEQAFQELKQALLTASALALPDITKDFQLYIDERNGVAKGVLVQPLGPWRRPVAYLSKKLDTVAAGWPACLRIIAAVALLVKDADKLTLGQPLAVTTSHSIEQVLKKNPDKWMTDTLLTHYQALLLATPRISFRSSHAPP